MRTVPPRASEFTPREREVWSLVSGHLTNQQIADQLCLSVRTVESHVSSLMRKAQVPDRRSLARLAGPSDAAVPLVGGHRWPAPLSSFVGRAVECAALTRAVAEHRLVTVTGAGGIGKTRLALHVTHQVASGRRDVGWFVDLAEVTDPQMVMPAIATAVGVAEPHGRSLDDALMTALAASDGVILLDNCEHLVDAVRSCTERLLLSCLSLTIVTTSRIRLGAAHEWVYVAAGLSVTEDGDDAVELFVERATAAGASETFDRQQVAVLCRALDGMALAIELAAARSPSLGLDGLVGGLDDRLRFLTSTAGLPDRHRSLRDALAWSYDLLTADDRALLCTVSVFASSFDAEAAIATARAETRDDVVDGLARLAEQSLLVAEPGQPTRYRALETIRQYAAEQLRTSGMSDVVHDRHRRWCTGELTVLAEMDADAAWCERFDRVAADARAALIWAADHGLDTLAGDLAERLAAQLFLRGRPAEAQRRYEQAARHTAPGLERARLLRLAAGAAATRLVGDDTLRLLREAADESQASGDHAGAAADLAWMAIYFGQAPGIIATLPDPQTVDEWLQGARLAASGSAVARATVAAAVASGLPDGHGDVEESTARAVDLAREAGAPLVESAALDRLCAHHLSSGDLAKALEVVGRRGEILRTVRLEASSGFQFNDYLLMASELHVAAGNLALAREYADALAGLACYREQGYPAIARRVKVDAMAGDLERAAAGGEQFLAAWERAGRPRAATLNVSAHAVAMVHGLLGDEGRRRQWLDITISLMGDPERLTTCVTGWAPTFDALVALDQDRADIAVVRLSADIDDPDVWTSWAAAMWREWYAALWAEAAVLARHPEAETRLHRARQATVENPIASAIVERAAHLTTGDDHTLRRHAQTFAELGCDYQRRRTERLLATGGHL